MDKEKLRQEIYAKFSSNPVIIEMNKDGLDMEVDYVFSKITEAVAKEREQTKDIRLFMERFLYRH